jgi:hypothetical protein
MTVLPCDVTRCVGTFCSHRHTCARFMDVPVDHPYVPYSDFSGTIRGDCKFFIQWEEEK